MQPDFEKRMNELETKINAIYESVEKTRKYFFWTMIVTLAVIVLPLIGLMFIIPYFLSNYTNSFLGNYTSAIETLGV